MTEILRITKDQSAYFQICLKYLSDVIYVKWTVLCLNSCQNTSVDFAKVTYSTQYCLLSLLEKWKSAGDKRKSFGALLRDLSKTFCCLSHQLLLAKLHAYGLNVATLRLIHNYLTNRKQRAKVNLSYSPWEEILFGVPQGFILGPLLFNIFLCDLFFIMNKIDLTLQVMQMIIRHIKQ